MNALKFMSVACLAIAAVGADVIPPKPVDGKVRWLFDYDEAKMLARQTGRPMFVVFRCER